MEIKAVKRQNLEEIAKQLVEKAKLSDGYDIRVDEEGELYINFGKDTISPDEALELLLTPILARDVT